MISKKNHWEKIYHTKHNTEVSWYRPHLETSMRFIEMMDVGTEANIIDVGGGASTLVDDLLGRGYRNITVVDLAASALEVSRQRLGKAADQITWIVGDITKLQLPKRKFHLWHDRAVFHFLANEADRSAYIRQVCQSLKEGGFIVLATFGPQGPKECSGLPVARYSTEELHGLFGEPFSLIEHTTEKHATPSGADQEFTYCCCLKRETR